MDLRVTPERRDAVLRAIAVHIDEHGYAPTVREIRERAGISTTSVVSYHLGVLRDQGLIDWCDGMARTLSVTARGRVALLQAVA